MGGNMERVPNPWSISWLEPIQGVLTKYRSKATDVASTSTRERRAQMLEATIGPREDSLLRTPGCTFDMSLLVLQETLSLSTQESVEPVLLAARWSYTMLTV